MPFCRSCGSQMTVDDGFCRDCGAALEAVSAAGGSTSNGWTGGQVLSLIGSVMLAVGPFMAWATAGIFSASGLQKTGNEAIALVVLGVIGAAISLVSLVQKRSALSFIPLIIGLIGLVMSIYYYTALRDDLSGFDNELFTASLGAGIYVCLIGGALLTIGALLGRLKLRRG